MRFLYYLRVGLGWIYKHWKFILSLFLPILVGLIVSHFLYIYYKNHIIDGQTTFFICTTLVFIIFLIVYRCVYREWPSWSGMGSTTKRIISTVPNGKEITTIEISPGKNLWNLLELIIIPAIIAYGIWYLNQEVRKNELLIAEKRIIEDRRILDDQKKDEILRSYLDDMGKLLLENNLKLEKNVEESSLNDVARVKTVIALKSLDMDRRNIIFQFLRDSGLSDFILVKVTMNGINLVESDISKLNLSGATLKNVNLMRADMRLINLSRTYLREARLDEANLESANLNRAFLNGATMVKTNLSKSNLSNAWMVNVDFNDANLSNCDLSGANLTNANLNGADLSKANLTNAIVTLKQIKKAKSLNEVIMPDGSVYK